MIDLVETSKLDELSGKVVVTTTYDNSTVLKANEIDRSDVAPKSHKKYGDKVLVHAARIHLGDIVRLRNMGYDLLSSDPDEVRRALLYVQQNEQMLLTVQGKPFAKKRPKWE